MLRQYGTREQAKREIFARYASFIYMGSGRYGFAAASEYYFGKPLAATRSPMRAGRAAGGHRQVAPRVRARAGRLGTAATAQPDPGPDGPERLHLRRARPARPGRTDQRGARATPKTEAPAVVEHVLDELQRYGGASSRSRTCSRAGYASGPRSTSGCRRSSTRPWRTASLATKSGIPARRGSIQGSVVVLANDDAAILAEAGGRQVYNVARPATPTSTAPPDSCASPARR